MALAPGTLGSDDVSSQIDQLSRTMRTGLAVVLGALLTCTLTGCQEGSVWRRDEALVEISSGVSRQLADHRAARFSDLRYRLSFAIPAERSDPIHGQLTASFAVSQPGPVVFDFAQPAEHVGAVLVDGAPVPYEVRNEHIILTDGVVAGAVAVEIEFTAGDGSLNRQDEFLYTLFVPDRARVAFPLFDQPNLKARFQLSLEVPSEWQAVANGSISSHAVHNDRAVYTFTETDPISSYLFSFVAGKFEVEEAERAGRRMMMYHRETDEDQTGRNRDAVFDLHASALEWLEDYTGIPYPFEKFDVVLIPSFQYTGMEHPGAILYRADSLFLDESATQNQLLGRASVIAHETAHMWFGDFVTMEWFNDVWMKEVFANFMAAKIVNPAFPDVDHDLRFLLAHYPAAYGVDRTEGANPIRQVLDNLNEAGTLYGPIIYQKAPVVMQQLERLVGEAAFRDGLREYLGAHRYANATWSDLITVLDRRSPDDLDEWSRVWVEESRRPTVEVVMESDDQTITALSLQQSDPANRGRLWNQRLDVLLGYGDGTAQSIPTQLRETTVSLPEAVGRPVPDFVLANGTGVGYGLMALDSRSLVYLAADLPVIADPMTRAIAWVSLWDALLEGWVEPEALIELAQRALPVEADELNIQRILGYLTSAYWRHVLPDRREALAGELEALLWRQTTSADRPTLAAAFLGAYRNVALTPEALARLERIWREEERVPGLPLSERDLIAIAQGLALRGVADSDAILATQRDRIDNPDRKDAFEFVTPALSADPATRDAFFASLSAPDNRERESWVLTALGFLHHPLRARQSEHYIRPSLDLLEEIQQTGDIFFPDRWLDATLGGHQTASAVGIVQQYLDERSDLAPRLRAKVRQSADGLVRAARIVGGGEQAPLNR